MPISQDLINKINGYEKQGATAEQIIPALAESKNFPDVAAKVKTYMGQGRSASEILQGLKSSPVKTPAWVKVADFLTGHFPYGEEAAKAENELINGKINPNIQSTKIPFYQDPVFAVGMGIGAGVKAATNPIITGIKEGAGWMTGGVSDIPALATKGGKAVIKAASAKNKAARMETLRAAGKDVPVPAKVVDAPQPALKSVLPELPKYAEGSSINLEKLNTSDDLSGYINNVTQQLESAIGKRKIGWDETRASAEQLGWSIKDIRKAWDKKGSFTAAEMDATRQTNLNTISSVYEKIKQLPEDRAQWTPEIRADFLDAMDLIKTTSQASSEAGRALNIHKRVLANDPAFTEAAQINNVLKNVSGKNGAKTDELIDAMRTLDFNNPAEVNQFVYNATKTPWQKLSDGAFSLWINGLLSNPLTHIINTTSNALTLAYSVPERLMASGIDTIRAATTKTPKELFTRSARQDTFSFFKSLQDGAKRFADTMAKGDLNTKFDYKYSGIPDKIEKYLPTRALTAEDAFFKGFIENQELNRIAYNTARKEGLKGEALQGRITELLNTPTVDMLERAAERGKYLTYQKELGSIGSWILHGRNTVPGLKYFLPFVKTPTNIAKFALERTPLGFMNVTSKALKGNLKGAELSEELAKPMLGSLLGYTVYQLAEMGYVTGGKPKSKAAQDEKINIGWLPYSIKAGDKYYSFARMEPIASIMGMAADMSQIKKEMSEDDRYNLAAGISGAITNNISNKTFMQGITNVINFIADPSRYGKQFVGNLAGSVIPAVSAGIARGTDDSVRDTRTVSDVMQSRIPVVSKSLPEKLTVWGEPLKRTGTPAERMLSPVAISQEKGSPIEKELANLKVDIGLPDRKIKGVELSPEEYWQIVRSSGSPAKKILDDIVASPRWQNMAEETKREIIKTVVNQFRDQTRQIAAVKMLKDGRLKINKYTGKLEAANTK